MNAADPRVIEILNDVLCAELTAINQYFLHAEMCNDWGYERLYKKIRKESIDEMIHAEQLIERILFLNGVPNVQKLGRIRIGENVEEQLKVDLALEEEALPRLNKGIQVCTEVGDNGTRALLESILTSEEEHVDWLEAQLDQINQIGIANYLTLQVKNDEE